MNFCEDCLYNAGRLYWILIMLIFMGLVSGLCFGTLIGLKIGGFW